MKTLSILTAAFLTAASVASADVVDTSEFVTTFVKNDLAFSVTSTGRGSNALDTFRLGEKVNLEWVAWEAAKGNANSYLSTNVGYNRSTEYLSVGIESGIAYAVNGSLDVYGSTNIDYVASVSDLDSGDVFVKPELGTVAYLSDATSLFANVDYTFDATNDFDGLGGTAELGLGYSFSEAMLLQTSVVRSFNTSADATNLKVEAVFNF